MVNAETLRALVSMSGMVSSCRLSLRTPLDTVPEVRRGIVVNVEAEAAERVTRWHRPGGSGAHDNLPDSPVL